MTWAVHISLAPTWFDPAETSGIIRPFIVLLALHDAVGKPLTGNPMAPALAESWTVSPDGLVYEFVLRRGARFHNGDPVTAEDVKFSFERYRGTASKPLKESVAAIETPDPSRVRFRLKRPWPDFMTFYAGATGAGWIVPKKYVEKVGDEGFKKMPIGAGPYRFVSFTPGVELVVEAFDQYWRKAPSVKRLVLKAIPDETTRLAALKRGEVDVAYNIRGALAEKILAEAGYPNGFDAGDYFCDAAIVFVGEPVVNYLNAAGIRVRLRPIERAAFFKGWADKKYKGLIQGASAAYGSAATRIEAF